MIILKLSCSVVLATAFADADAIGRLPDAAARLLELDPAIASAPQDKATIRNTMRNAEKRFLPPAFLNNPTRVHPH